MPMTYAEHDKKDGSLRQCANCLPLRDLPQGDNVMVRTNGAFVAGYELGPLHQRISLGASGVGATVRCATL